MVIVKLRTSAADVVALNIIKFNTLEISLDPGTFCH